MTTRDLLGQQNQSALFIDIALGILYIARLHGFYYIQEMFFMLCLLLLYCSFKELIMIYATTKFMFTASVVFIPVSCKQPYGHVCNL